MTVGFPQDESVSCQNKRKKHQDEAGPASQVAVIDVGKQTWAGWSKACETPPAHERQEGDEDGRTPEGHEAQQGSSAGQ